MYKGNVVLKKVLKRIDNFEEYILAFLLPLMCIIIFVATTFRFTKILIIPWAEELARYCMIWILFFGASAAAKRGEHFCVTVFTTLLPLPVQKVLVVIRMALMMGFSLFVSRFCIVILQSQMMMGQVSPSLKVPMWIMYTSVLIGCILMLFRYIAHGIQELRSGKGLEKKG